MMTYFLQGFGVFLGVIAGVAIELIIQWIGKCRREKEHLKNLKFEFQLNIRKIDNWLEEMVNYRNAVNGNAMNTWFGYFDLSRFVYPTANAMFLSGLLYKYLSKEEISKLQVVASEFSLNWELLLNNQIATNRANFNQAQAVFQVNFWENKFRAHKQTLEDILRRLN